MENDRTDEILHRIDALEQKLTDLGRRIDQLENPVTRRAFPQSRPVGSVPPVLPPSRRDVYFATKYLGEQEAKAQPQPKDVVEKPKRDLEYLIGAQILPKAAAAMTILGLILLVILAYRNKWITPAMMFGFEVLFCGAFVVTGILKRDMKEEFGQILTAIGSCGLYLVFAGGHLYYHLYKGETLIALFFLLSLANLAFSLWRSSRSFLVLGLIGGLITASVLPNLQSDHSVVNAWIHFLILIPTALIIAKNKWLPLAPTLWLAATTALAPILTNSLVWYDKVAILYASSAICMATYSWAYYETDVDPYNTGPAIMLWLTGLIGFAVNQSRAGAWQFLGFFLLFGALAAAFSKNARVRNSLLAAAVGVPMTIAPYCFPLTQAIEILAVLSILSSLVALRFIPKVAATAGVVEFILAAFTYMQIVDSNPSWRTETTILILFAAAVIAGARALVKAGGKNETYTLTAAAICVPILTRLAVVLFGLPGVGWHQEFSIALALTVFVYYALVLYLRTKWNSALIAFWTLYALAIIAYLSASIVLNMSFDTGLLIALMLAPALFVTITPENIHHASAAWSAAIIGALFTRLVVVLGVPLLHWSASEACTIGAVIYSAACFTYVWAKRKTEFLYAGWILLIVGACAYASDWTFPLMLSLWLMSALLFCLVLGGRATAPFAKNRQEFAVFISLAGWVAFSRWSWLLLALAIPSLDSSPAISIGWTAYFFGLIALGFAYRVVQFRYVAFVVLATTVLKILLIDLATTDAMIRVAVTIVAGLVMLAASGYWYVRSKEHPAITDR